MSLDVGTLMLGNSMAAGASAVLLLVVWLEDRTALPPLLWAASHLSLACAIAILALAEPSPDTFRLQVCTVLFGGADALLFCGALLFQSRQPVPPLIVAGVAIAILLSALAGVGVAPVALTASSQVVMAGFIFGAAYVLWSGRGEALKARGPLVIFVVAHGVAVALRIADSFGGSVTMQLPSATSIFGVIHFETIAFTIATAVLMTSMLRERKEVAERDRSTRDPLIVDLLNRRGFVAEAEQQLERSAEDDAPFALLLFDLDFFKRVNDTYGHQVGDEVLVLFGTVLRRTLRPTDIIGRLGGEEFAAVLPRTSLDCAVVLAERTRGAFAEAARFVVGRPVRSTVTVGVTASEGPQALSTLLEAADSALYEAKSLGRNRVRVYGESRRARPAVVRIA